MVPVLQKAVLAVEAAGMEVAEPDIRAVLVVDQVMSTLLSLLQIIQMVVYLTLLIIFLMLKLLPEINSFPAPSGSTETGHSGNGHVKITKLSDVIYLTHAKNNIMDFNIQVSTTKTLKPGTYTIECWGWPRRKLQ